MSLNKPANIENKRIIITGGTSGMGKILVEAFPSLGAHIVFFGRNQKVGDTLAKTTGTTFIQTDIADQTALKNSMAKAITQLGGLDTLINTAGISPGAKAEEILLEDWNEVMDINSTGTFLSNTLAFPYLKENGGTILNFSSAGGILGYPNKAHYAASKGAVTAWVRSVAKEWAPYGIRVNAIAPAIWTPMYDKTRAAMSPEQLAAHDEMLKANIPLGGKLGDVEQDYLPIMRFLCSDDARFMTGQMFAVDGGALMLR